MKLSVEEMIGFFKKSVADQEEFLNSQDPELVQYFLNQLNLVVLNKMMTSYQSENLRRYVALAMRNTDKVD
ncbi:MAG: hypothetical protein JNL13_14145 [Chitinophagaceae bacterium]|nr:hypothetical protein [Chitinophagaceae bacterium]